MTPSESSPSTLLVRSAQADSVELQVEVDTNDRGRRRPPPDRRQSILEDPSQTHWQPGSLLGIRLGESIYTGMPVSPSPGPPADTDTPGFRKSLSERPGSPSQIRDNFFRVNLNVGSEPEVNIMVQRFRVPVAEAVAV